MRLFTAQIPYKIRDVRPIVFSFEVSTDQKVGGSSPSKRTTIRKLGRLKLAFGPD